MREETSLPSERDPVGRATEVYLRFLEQDDSSSIESLVAELHQVQHRDGAGLGKIAKGFDFEFSHGGLRKQGRPESIAEP